MGGKFIIAGDVKLEQLDWGKFAFLSNPPNTGATQITSVDGRLCLGKGHDFHRHPQQEEFIFIVAGKVEQWIDREKRILVPGDSVFIPSGVVHASFGASDDEARMIAVFSPCVGPVGLETVDMASEAPWKNLRSQ